MLENIITILKVLGLAFLITRFEPIKWLFEILSIKYGNTLIFNLIYLLVSCMKCCATWIGLIMGGIWIGIISFILSFVYTKCCSVWENRVRLK